MRVTADAEAASTADRNRLKELALRASAGAWGLALALGLAPWLQSSASPEALPSAMAAAGMNAATPIRQILAIILLPPICVFVSRFIPAFGTRWSFVFASVALATAPLSILCGAALGHVIVHLVVAAGVIALQRLQPNFSRGDVILIPTGLVTYFAVLSALPAARPITSFQVAVLAVFALRLFFRAAHAFALAPLAILFPWAAAKLVWVLLSPFVLQRVNLPATGRLIALLIYPVFVTAYPLALLGIAAPPHLAFFEDGHELLPAAEMARGERPYADIVPVHSLLADGGIASVVIASGGGTAADILRVRLLLSALNLTAIYFVTLAATGSAEAGLLAVMFGVSLFPASTIWIRSMPALFAVAAAVAAVRSARARWMVATGALLVLAFFTGMEFAVYSGIASLVAAWRMRDRTRAFSALLIGIGAAATAALVLLTAGGILVPFLRTTLTELLPAGPLYVPGPLVPPEFLRSLSGVIAGVGRPEALQALFWLSALILSPAMLGRLRSRGDTPWIIGLWIVVAGISFAQRRHAYFGFLIAPFVISALVELRRFDRRIFTVLAVAVTILSNPLAHVFDVATPLRLAGGVPAGRNVRLAQIPRGGDAVAPPEISTAITAAKKFVDSTLRRDETWFDFANAPALYFFLERDAPVRHHQVVFYESEAAQRDVIRVLEQNRNVRAVLMDFPGGLTIIDGVSNRTRTPLVARYIDEHFRPAFAESGTVFWVRR